MIKFLREVLGYLLIQLNYISKTKRSGILSITFHNPSKILFDKILKWLVKNEYKFISIKELEYYITHKIKIDKLALITFDDGWKENLELFNSIEKYKVPVGIFIPTNSIQDGNYWWEYARIKGQEKITKISTVEGFKKIPEEVFSEKINALKQNNKLERSCITLSQLKQLANNKLVTIGSHTVTHSILKKCSAEKQISELNQSKQQLDDWLGKETEYFSYPNGDYDDASINIARSTGYKLCFTTQPSMINVEKLNPYLVPRYSINEKGGYYENIAKILGIWYVMVRKRTNN